MLREVIDAQNSFYSKCGFQVRGFVAEEESSEYYAYSYSLDNKNIRFRFVFQEF